MSLETRRCSRLLRIQTTSIRDIGINYTGCEKAEGLLAAMCHDCLCMHVQSQGNTPYLGRLHECTIPKEHTLPWEATRWVLVVVQSQGNSPYLGRLHDGCLLLYNPKGIHPTLGNYMMGAWCYEASVGFECVSFTACWLLATQQIVGAYGFLQARTMKQTVAGVRNRGLDCCRWRASPDWAGPGALCSIARPPQGNVCGSSSYEKGSRILCCCYCFSHREATEQAGSHSAELTILAMLLSIVSSRWS